MTKVACICLTRTPTGRQASALAALRPGDPVAHLDQGIVAGAPLDRARPAIGCCRRMEGRAHAVQFAALFPKRGWQDALEDARAPLRREPFHESSLQTEAADLSWRLDRDATLQQHAASGCGA